MDEQYRQLPNINFLAECLVYIKAFYNTNPKHEHDINSVHLSSLPSYSQDFFARRTALDLGYAAVWEDRVVFAFRGTKNGAAWVSNFMVGAAKEAVFEDGPWGRGMIAKGFYEGWVEYKGFVNDVMAQYGAGRRVVCTGYSRGGAIATLAARHIAKNLGAEEVGLVTWGAPAQGNASYRDQLNLLPINHTRVVNGMDVVVELPPAALGFRHGGNEKRIGMAVGWAERLLFAVMPSLRISHHLLPSYTSSLRSYLGAKGDRGSLKYLDVFRY